jgi:hypothetical protein
MTVSNSRTTMAITFNDRFVAVQPISQQLIVV